MPLFHFLPDEENPVVIIATVESLCKKVTNSLDKIPFYNKRTSNKLSPGVLCQLYSSGIVYALKSEITDE